MIVLVQFKDIAKRIALINRESWRVKVQAVVTHRHIICTDTDNNVEFFRYPVDNTRAFMYKLFMLYQAMLNFDYDDVGKIRPTKNKRYSKKLQELWIKANELKLLK